MFDLLMNGNEVRNYLIHRWPFLLVDGVIDITGQIIEGFKNVSMSDIWFMGHFPEVAIFPGVLIIEALAQLSGIYVIKTSQENEEIENKIGMLMAVKNFKCIKPVIPGSKLVLKAQLKGISKFIYIFDVKANVENDVVASGTIQLYLQESSKVL